MRVDIQVDDARLQYMRQAFARWPRAVEEIMRESLNRTAEKARTTLKERIAAALPGMKTGRILSRLKLTKATLKKWTANVGISGKGLPVSQLGFKAGRTKKTYFHASEKHSAWLYYHVFLPKYGDAAVYSRSYRIMRKAYPNMTYQVMGQTVTINEPGAFVQTVKSRFALAGAKGHRGVFIPREDRKGKAGFQGVHEAYGPGLGSMLADEKTTLEKVKVESGDILSAEISARIKRYLAMMAQRRAG